MFGKRGVPKNLKKRPADESGIAGKTIHQDDRGREGQPDNLDCQVDRDTCNKDKCNKDNNDDNEEEHPVTKMPSILKNREKKRKIIAMVRYMKMDYMYE